MYIIVYIYIGSWKNKRTPKEEDPPTNGHWPLAAFSHWFFREKNELGAGCSLVFKFPARLHQARSDASDATLLWFVGARAVTVDTLKPIGELLFCFSQTDIVRHVINPSQPSCKPTYIWFP